MELNRQALASLKRRWRRIALLVMLILIAAAAALTYTWYIAAALQWLIVASGVMIYQLVLLWRRLPHNHRRGEAALLPILGVGNTLTVVRGILLAMLAGFLFLPWTTGWLAWTPGIIYLIAAIVDFFDGFLARRLNQSTALGEYLDLEWDALGILIAPMLAVWYRQLPPWYLIVSAARYLYAAGIALVERRGGTVHPLTPSTIRRALAGFQMGITGGVLLPVFSPPETWIAATVFMIPFLLGFLRDWLVVSGAIDPASWRYTSARRWTKITLLEILPVALRGLVATIVLWQNFSSLNLFQIALAVLVTLGIAGRSFSLVLLIMAGFIGDFRTFNSDSILVAALSALTVLGTGAWSLWQPEEWFIQARFGEKRLS